MTEDAGRCRVGQVVCRDVYGLDGCDGSVFGRGDAFLQFADVGRKGRLVTDGGRHTAEQCGNFGACLDETENVVDEEQDVLMFFITEIFRHGEAGQGDTHTGSRRFVHLAVDEGGFGENAGFFHFAPEVVAFTGAFPDAAEDGAAGVLGRDVVDEFLNQNCLADACAAEEADFPAFRVRSDEVDDFDAGFKNFRCRALVFEGRSGAVDGPMIVGFDFCGIVVDGIAEDVEDTSQDAVADGNRDGFAGVKGFHSSDHAVCGAHGYTAYNAVTEVLHGFANDVDRNGSGVVFDANGIVHGRQFGIFVKGDVDDGADDLYDFSFLFLAHEEAFLLFSVPIIRGHSRRRRFRRFRS